MRNPYRNYIILNNKEIKKFHSQLKEQFGFSKKLDYLFFQKKDKFYIISKKFKDLNIENLNLNSLGLYIAKKEIPGIRLSIEGSQLIGPSCNKNILTLKDPNDWLQGKEIQTNKRLKGFVIIKHKKDFLGSGLYKKNKILNFIPKSRRIK